MNSDVASMVVGSMARLNVTSADVDTLTLMELSSGITSATVRGSVLGSATAVASNTTGDPGTPSATASTDCAPTVAPRTQLASANPLASVATTSSLTKQ